MTDKPTWETFFDAHAPFYADNVFTRNITAEVENRCLITRLG